MADPDTIGGLAAGTIEDLGRMLKQKHPGAYDFLPDADLGRRAKQKKPQEYGQIGRAHV